MAVAKALISAADLLKPNTKLLKKSTATELATSSSQPDPVASTDDVSRLPLTGLQGSASEDGSPNKRRHDWGGVLTCLL